MANTNCLNSKIIHNHLDLKPIQADQKVIEQSAVWITSTVVDQVLLNYSGPLETEIIYTARLPNLTRPINLPIN